MSRPVSTAVKDAEHLDLAELYRTHLEILGYRPKTCRSRFLYLNEFLSWRERSGKLPIAETTSEEIQRYYAYLGERKNRTTGGKLHAKTKHAHLKVIRDFFSLLQEEKGLSENPCSSLNFDYPTQTTERDILTQEEIRELYEVCEDAQERAILSLVYGCGLRAEEAVKIDIRHVRLKDKILIVERGKGNKRRVIPLSSGVAKDLSEYFYYEREHLKTGKDYRHTNFAFMLHSRGGRMQQPTYNKHLKAIIERTENQRIIRKNITLHNLRHSIATHLLERGIPTLRVREFLGHSQAETTQIYTHVSRAQLRKMSQKINHDKNQNKPDDTP